MTPAKLRTIWAWFAAQWKPNLPAPIMQVRPIIWHQGRLVTGLSWCGLWVKVVPWCGRRIVVHEFAHHLGFYQENTQIGRDFLAAAGRPQFDEKAREMWANTVCGMLGLGWRGGNMLAAPAIRPLLR